MIILPFAPRLVDANGNPLATPETAEIRELKQACDRFDQGFREVGLLPAGGFCPRKPWHPWTEQKRQQTEWYLAEMQAGNKIKVPPRQGREQLIAQINEYVRIRPFLDPPAVGL